MSWCSLWELNIESREKITLKASEMEFLSKCNLQMFRGRSEVIALLRNTFLVL